MAQGPTPFANGVYAPFFMSHPTTFAKLPANPRAGMQAVITDSTTAQAGAAAAGSGGLTVELFYDGTAWRVVSAASPVAAGYSAANSAVSFTATAAQIGGGAAFNELDLTGNPAGAANVTLPTVAALVAALPNPVAGTSYLLRIKNSANSGTWTVVTNTGWTLNGTVTIATGTWRDFVVTLTSLTAATLQNAGGGATL